MNEKLRGRRGLIVGAWNEHCLAFGSALALAKQGSNLTLAGSRHVAPPKLQALGAQLGGTQCLPLDVSAIDEWPNDQIVPQPFDFIVYGAVAARAEDIARPLTECSGAGFAEAMQTGCHTVLRLAGQATKLLAPGGMLVILTHYGLTQGSAGTTVLAPVQAALAAGLRDLPPTSAGGVIVRQMAAGPLNSHAATGLPHLDALIEAAIERTPATELMDGQAFGTSCADLVSS